MRMTELQLWTMDALNLMNISYTVSNKGKQFTTKSKLSTGTIRIYPTTGSYIQVDTNWKTKSFTMEKYDPLESKKNNIRRMIRYNFNPNF